MSTTKLSMLNLDGIDLSSCISVESFAYALHFVEGVRSLNCRLHMRFPRSPKAAAAALCSTALIAAFGSERPSICSLCNSLTVSRSNAMHSAELRMHRGRDLRDLPLFVELALHLRCLAGRGLAPCPQSPNPPHSHHRSALQQHSQYQS